MAKLAADAGRRADVLDVLRHTPQPMSIAEIADRLDLHVNTVRFHLGTLVSNGQAERVTAQSRTPGRPAQLFRATRGMDPMGPRHYRVLAEALAAGLAADPDPSGRAVHAGRVWGRAHTVADQHEAPTDDGAAVGHLTALLDELGFAPERASRDGESQILLHHCPFLELATRNPEVICAVHLGLMRGALESWNSAVTVERLDPFVEPNLCMAHLRAAAS